MGSSRAGSRPIWVALGIVAVIDTWMVVAAYLCAPNSAVGDSTCNDAGVSSQ